MPDCVWCATYAQACTIRGIEPPLQFPSPVPVSEMALRGRFGDEFKVPERGCMRAQNSMMPRENIFNENGTYRNSPQADASVFWGKFWNALVAVEKQLDGFGPTTLSFLEHELLGGIMRTRKTCANPRCGEAFDVCSWRQLHQLPVPQKCRQGELQAVVG